MKTQSSAHVHTQFCDGRNTAEEMVQSALRFGFVSLGFSSHAPQPFDARYSIEHEAPYRGEILRLKEKYRARIPLYLGMERDLYSFADPKDYDYFIGSVHYLPNEEERCPVDGAPEPLQKYTDTCCGGDGLKTARRYYSMLAQYVQALPPSIIGHFDLIRKNNPRLRLFDEESPAYRRIALDALDAVRHTGALLEVNTGGMARGYLPCPYPAMFLLKAWREWGGRVILNSDCHQAPLIAFAFDEAEAYIRAAGFKAAVRLGSGKEKWEEYGL